MILIFPGKNYNEAEKDFVTNDLAYLTTASLAEKTLFNLKAGACTIKHFNVVIKCS